MQTLLHPGSRDGILRGAGERHLVWEPDLGCAHGIARWRVDDPSELAFRLAAIMARFLFLKTKPVILEPMKVVAQVEFQSAPFPCPFLSSS